MIRTALFNWAYARHTGGTFVFRIEDTDAARDSQESYLQLLDALRWLGLDWDEGVEVGGPHEPYRQSQRSDLYADVVRRLVEGGYAYESFSTPEEIEARHKAAGRDPKLGYDGADRDLTDEQKAFFRAEGREPMLRLRMPDDDITFTDLVRGEITFQPGSVPDFVIVRANGQPLYTLVNPVDDALMGITHVLRGEDLLSSTPRQIALYRALLELGVATRRCRCSATCRRCSARATRSSPSATPSPNLFLHRDRGFTPEGLLNYLALLGWSIGPDRDIFTMAEMTAAFDVADVNPNPARFDLKKAEAINSAHIRMLAPDDFRDRLVPYLHRAGPRARGLVRRPDAGAPRAARRGRPADPGAHHAAGRGRGHARLPVRRGRRARDRRRRPRAPCARSRRRCSTPPLAALAALPADGFTHGGHAGGAAGGARRRGGLALKPRFAFTPLRVALSGRRISPPLFESMEILGRDATLARLTALREAV